MRTAKSTTMFKKKRKATAVILFADLAQSSEVYKKAGDKAGQRFIGTCIDTLSRVAVESGGSVLKTIGDEVMCRFNNGSDAVNAAVAMHNALDLDQACHDLGLQPPNLYVGMHKGAVVLKKNDVFGRTVNVAAYLVKLAKPRQILITGALIDDLEDTRSATLHLLFTTPVKGEGDVAIYEYVWEIQDATVVCHHDGNRGRFSAEAAIELHYSGRTVSVDKDSPRITIGRQPHNDIIIKDTNASRTHAIIEYRHGKLFLIDQSSNGTFLQFRDGRALTLNNEETPLTGKGRISPGRDFSTHPPDVIQFSCAP
ncbi:MAG: adenylate/guanylate cyclase domain-containing protein [Thermodesulfobacteriota bacterium]|nr:adenylate/guanylate cyclase domain-containing protein [Thermodesulfobacteriota bacterium]